MPPSLYHERVCVTNAREMSVGGKVCTYAMHHSGLDSRMRAVAAAVLARAQLSVLRADVTLLKLHMIKQAQLTIQNQFHWATQYVTNYVRLFIA